MGHRNSSIVAVEKIGFEVPMPQGQVEQERLLHHQVHVMWLLVHAEVAVDYLNERHHLYQASYDC